MAETTDHAEARGGDDSGRATTTRPRDPSIELSVPRSLIEHAQRFICGNNCAGHRSHFAVCRDLTAVLSDQPTETEREE